MWIGGRPQNQTSANTMLWWERNSKRMGINLKRFYITGHQESKWSCVTRHISVLLPGKVLGTCVSENPKRGDGLYLIRNKPNPLPQTLGRKRKEIKFWANEVWVLNFKAERDCDVLFWFHIECNTKASQPLISSWTTVCLGKLLVLNLSTSTNSLCP